MLGQSEGFLNLIDEKERLPNLPVSSGHRPITSLRVGGVSQGSTALTVCGGTSGEKARGNVDIPGAKGTGKSLHYFAVNVTMNHN